MKQNYFHNEYRNTLRLVWIGFFAILLMTNIGFGTLKAQASGYVFAQTIGTFSPISGGNVLGTATGNAIGTPSLDTEIYPVTLPFAINFNNVNYSDVSVSSNGFLTFGSTPASGTTPISTATAWGGVVSAWGRDINAVFDISNRTGNISWKVEGTAPSRTIVFQWENFRPAYTSSTTSAYVFSFQIRLAETTNVISTVYAAGGFLIGNTGSSATNTQIGLRGITISDYNNRFNPATVVFGSSTIGTANSNGQSFNTVADPPGMPADGLTYTWTPPTCLGPSALVVTNITTISADLSWTASGSAPANGYDIYYSMSNVAPTGSTVPNFANVAGLTQSLSGLTASSQYFVWMRSVCSNSDKSNWVSLPTFNTTCAPITSMYENFDGYATGSIVPNCWDRIISGTGTQTISTSTPNSTPNNLYQFSSNTSNQTIVVLPVFSNISAGTHWLRLKARVGTAPRTIEFGYVTNATDANSFVLIEAKSITNTTYASTDSEYTIAVPNTVPVNARLAIKNPGTLSTTFYYDDVYWEQAPTCFPPTNIVTSNATPTGVDVSWTASITPPGNGYEVYYSTSNTPPTAATVPNATGITGLSTTLSGLNSSTGYFVWVRSKCSAADVSAWSTLRTFNTSCLPPAITGTTGATVCPNSTATLTASADPGATLKWYDAATGGALVATGPSFTTPALSSTTNYYVSASTGATSNVGKIMPESNATTGGGLTSYLVFTALSDFTLNTVDLFPFSSVDGTAGTATIQLLTSTGTPITSATVNVVGHNSVAASVPQTVTLNFPVIAGASYRLGVSAWTGITNMYRDATNLAFPYSLPGVVDITGGSLSTPYYYFFYNWNVVSGCESARTMVTATVDPVACLSTVEVDGKNKINVYPNPFTDVLNISDVKDVVSVSILALSGRLVKTIAKPSSQLNLAELKSGMYLIKLSYKDGSERTVKAMKK